MVIALKKVVISSFMILIKIWLGQKVRIIWLLLPSPSSEHHEEIDVLNFGLLLTVLNLCTFTQ